MRSTFIMSLSFWAHSATNWLLTFSFICRRPRAHRTGLVFRAMGESRQGGDGVGGSLDLPTIATGT
jgi:hypothetical protein